MKLSNFRRLIKEDVAQEYRSLIERIGYSVNTFAQEVINLSNKNITIQDNLFQEIKTIDVEVDSNGLPIITTQFKNNLKNTLKGIQVINVSNLTNTASYPSSGVLFTFSENNNIITIQHITGLLINNKYRITFITIGG